MGGPLALGRLWASYSCWCHDCYNTTAKTQTMRTSCKVICYHMQDIAKIQKIVRTLGQNRTRICPAQQNLQKRWWHARMQQLRCTTKYYDVLRRTTTYCDVLGRTTKYYEVLRGTKRYYDVVRGTTRYYEVLRRTTTHYGLL